MTSQAVIAAAAATLRSTVSRRVTSPTTTFTRPSAITGCALAGEATPTARTVPANTVAIDFLAMLVMTSALHVSSAADARRRDRRSGPAHVKTPGGHGHDDARRTAALGSAPAVDQGRRPR